jgi:hypothetical protein
LVSEEEGSDTSTDSGSGRQNTPLVKAVESLAAWQSKSFDAEDADILISGFFVTSDPTEPYLEASSGIDPPRSIWTTEFM